MPKCTPMTKIKRQLVILPSSIYIPWLYLCSCHIQPRFWWTLTLTSLLFHQNQEWGFTPGFFCQHVSLSRSMYIHSVWNYMRATYIGKGINCDDFCKMCRLFQYMNEGSWWCNWQGYIKVTESLFLTLEFLYAIFWMYYNSNHGRNCFLIAFYQPWTRNLNTKLDSWFKTKQGFALFTSSKPKSDSVIVECPIQETMLVEMIRLTILHSNDFCVYMESLYFEEAITSL